MIINFRDEIKKNTLLSHVVLTSLADTVEAVSTIRDERYIATGEVDLKLTANGAELDITKFLDHWQNSMNTIVTKAAKELLAKRFCTIANTLNDVEENVMRSLDALGDILPSDLSDDS